MTVRDRILARRAKLVAAVLISSAPACSSEPRVCLSPQCIPPECGVPQDAGPDSPSLNDSGMIDAPNDAGSDAKDGNPTD
jgi:hypothetical protein